MFLMPWVVIAFAILRRVDDRPREWGPDDLAELAGEGPRAAHPVA
jgi:hypothetical protein